MDYQNQYGLLRSSPSTHRSLSVASTTSSASHHSSFRPEFGTLSPASVISVPAPSMVTRAHRQLSHLHPGLPLSSSYTLPSTLLPVSSPYRQSQIISTMPPYTPVLPPRVFGQQFPSGFNFQLNTLPHHPSTSSYQTYPPIYPSLSNPLAYQQFSSASETPPTFKFFKWALVPPEIMKVIRAHVGYLGSRKLLTLNRWFKHSFDICHFSEDELIAGVLEAEQSFQRYHIDSQRTRLRHSDNRKTESGTTPADSFACYHCYKIKSPENFERFSWLCTRGNNDSDNNDGEDIESHHSAPANATASTSNTPRSRNPSLTTQPNPYYDPTITRSSVLQAQAVARGGSSNNSGRRRSNTPATAAASATPVLTALGANDPTTTGPISAGGRVGSTWGVRRFCIDCGIRKGFYKPTDLIEVHGARNVVNWVCQCLEVRVRSVPIRPNPLAAPLL
ncbi:hypothetical protein QBC37DRAFT_457669 [Rhypophila decipiens]|uniref:Uncharacterized protein n=1 Tax=Rhypophila decipiens TaxID=261697 RepID=A0AAN6XW35_9PEZI|nr:hypothetical protein QBC37DRAFT_457669 [Rhypophila decipiens]